MKNPKTALIIFTREGPALEGGGRGVTYQFLRGLAENFPAVDDSDMYCLFDDNLVPLRSSEDAIAALSKDWRSSNKHLPRWMTRAPKVLAQARIVSRLAATYQSTVLLAYTHFHASHLISKSHPLFVIHTEHSKGGMHTEHFAMKRRKDLQYRLMQFLCDLSMRRADRVVFPSNSAAEMYATHNPQIDFNDKYSIIYNGVEDPLHGGVSRQEAPSAVTTILNVAQHVPEKGIELVLEGLAIWKQKTSFKHPVRLLNCGGETGETPRLRELVHKLGISDMCDFLGWTPRSRVMELLGQADVFALTPKVAVFDLALLEAMALGKPILSTPVGGNMEALGKDYTAYVDSPIQFAKHLDLLVSQPASSARLGAANRHRFLSNFHLRSMVNGYVDLLEESSRQARSNRTAA